MGRKPLNRERINITMPYGLPKAMLDAAAREGRDRSDVISELCRNWLADRDILFVPLPAPKSKPRRRKPH